MQDQGILDIGKQWEQLLKDSRTYERVDRERKEVFEGLILHPGWKLYVELLSNIIESTGADLLAPSGSIEGVLIAEHLKGSMSGLIRARDLPSVMIAHMEAVNPSANLEDESDDSE